MDVVVRGKNCVVPERLQAVAVEKLPKINKFVHDVHRAEVEFSEEKNPRVANHFVCEITVHMPKHLMKAKGAAPEAFDALDRALHKTEQQAAKIHSKRVTRRRRAAPLGVVANEVGAVAVEETPTEELPEARIVKTKIVEMLAMDPEEAALRMDLLEHEFFFFKNARTGRAAVVYRRNDGDLGVLESEG